MAIREPEQSGKPERSDIHVGHLSYFFRLADAATFSKLAGGEMHRRQVQRAGQVCSVTDGAEWCQAFVEAYRPEAVRVLDFPHAAEHLSHLLETIEQTGVPVPPKLLGRCLHILKHRGPKPLLRLAEHLKEELLQTRGVQGHLDYFRKREALLQYPQVREQGWPIGSGMIENANKLVVQARLKGPGIHWKRKNVNPMLAVRTAECNDRWQSM